VAIETARPRPRRLIPGRIGAANWFDRLARMRLPIERKVRKTTFLFSKKKISLFARDFLQSRCTKDFRKAKKRTSAEVCLTPCGSAVVVWLGSRAGLFRLRADRDGKRKQIRQRHVTRRDGGGEPACSKGGRP
jgi:hypothetical protein